MRAWAQKPLLPVGRANGNDPVAPQRKLNALVAASDPQLAISYASIAFPAAVYHAMLLPLEPKTGGNKQ
jgi:hypothetical protein